MKTPKTFTEDFAKSFKKSYAFKMGGTQTVVMPNGQSFFFNDKEYYSGRGAKYNSSIKHDEIGDVIVTKKQVAEKLKLIREREKRIKLAAKEQKEAEKRYNENKAKGIYGLKTYDYGTFIEISREESMSRTFDAARLAKTLDISIEDANLLRSNGKTYVFAKQLSTGKIIQLYHSSLDCNYLSISVEYFTPEQYEEFKKSWGNKWERYSDLVGQTEEENHFVC